MEPNLLPSLLQILSTPNLAPPATRQSIAVFLKNRIKKTYHLSASPRPAPSLIQPIALADKESIKRAILPLLAREEEGAVRRQLSSIWGSVVQGEVEIGEGVNTGEGLGTGWKVEQIVEELKVLLNGNEIGSVVAGVEASLELVKGFGFRRKGTRSNMITSYPRSRETQRT